MDIINVIVNFWYVNIEVHIENVQKSFKVTHISINEIDVISLKNLTKNFGKKFPHKVFFFLKK